FGSWTALFLLRWGARVTLLDAWGPGNARASSGGETRIMRAGYGPNQPYSRMAVRALTLWREHEVRWARTMFHQTGVLWMAGKNDAFERGSLAELRDAGVPYQELSVGELKKRWPQINFEGVQWGFYEPEGGYLTARGACLSAVAGFLEEGGEFRQAWVKGEAIESAPIGDVLLSDSTRLAADQYVFACGPWLGKIFPDTIGDKILATKQDVLFLGAPRGTDLFQETPSPPSPDPPAPFLSTLPAHP